MWDIWLVYDGGMGIRCSGTVLGGEACRAWAVRGSEPPLCVAHAGLNKGAGAPKKNKNAVKHGFYRPGLTRSEMAWLKKHGEEVTIEAELAMVRVGLLRLAKFQKEEELSVEEHAAVVKLLVAGARTVAYLEQKIRDGGLDGQWDDVLDGLSEMIGVEL